MFRIRRVGDRQFEVYDDSLFDGLIGVWSRRESAEEQCDQLNDDHGLSPNHWEN